MTTTVRSEIRLANDIAAQFHYLPPARAAEAVAGHIRSFWDPRMRTHLFACVDAGTDGLDDLVLAAVKLLR